MLSFSDDGWLTGWTKGEIAMEGLPFGWKCNATKSVKRRGSQERVDGLSVDYAKPGSDTRVNNANVKENLAFNV